MRINNLPYISGLILTLLVGLVNDAIAQEFKLDNNVIWASGTFNAKSVYGVESMQDGIHFTRLENNQEGNLEIRKYKYDGYQLVDTILSEEELVYNGEQIKLEDYAFNRDESKLLILTEKESIYRHSFKAFYYIVDVATKEIESLSDTTKGKQRLAEFSPDGTMVAFVRDNNLFLKYVGEDNEKAITNDGEKNAIINGGTDWVYEEEFSFHKGFEWSPNSDKIAFYRFDESHVKEYHMPMYGSLYPEQNTFKYPKAGEDNSIVNIKVYNVNDNRTKDFYLGDNTDIYVPRIKWAPNGNILLVQRLNRLQNKIELLEGDFGAGLAPQADAEIKTIYTEKSDTYIDVHDNTFYTEDMSKILWTSERDGFNHIYFIDRNTGALSQVTSGRWEVTEVYGMNKKSKRIFFQAAKNNPTQREVYAVKGKGGELKQLSFDTGTNRAEFSHNFKYFLLFHSDANTPFTVSIVRNNKKLQSQVIENNEELMRRMEAYNFAPKEFFTVQNDDGIDLLAWMIRPADFNENKRYPVLMFVYNGPGINTVNDAWSYGNYFWFQALARKGYIVVSVDGRGTGYRGKAFKHSTYLELGKKESEDQIAAAKNLGKLSYIDSNRIGIFGWSYGGYLSSLCLAKGSDVFRAAIAVAPVTNWRFYDNIYTERFMRTPQENGENYDANSPINHVDSIKGYYLLIHGSADDNVHFQNSMEMADKLIEKNKQFDFMAYPNKNHGIYGGMTRVHLYDVMTKFIFRNL